jgi:hypothetical protein
MIEKPWITNALFKSIKRKNKLYKRFLSNPCNANNLIYKSYKNKLTCLLKLAKSRYYEHKICEASSNIKQTWKFLNTIINKRKDKNSIHSKFLHNNNLISDPVEVSNRFCGYFTNIGKNIAERIFDPGISPTSYLQDNICESIFLNPTTKEEI